MEHWRCYRVCTSKVIIHTFNCITMSEVIALVGSVSCDFLFILLSRLTMGTIAKFNLLP